MKATKEENVKYKAGDRVTIVLDATAAYCANLGYGVATDEGRIISHDRAPEPIVGYMNLYPRDFSGTYHSLEDAKDGAAQSSIGVIRLTYNPATKDVKAEVV